MTVKVVLLLKRFQNAENLRTFHAHSEGKRDCRVLEVWTITNSSFISLGSLSTCQAEETKVCNYCLVSGNSDFF